MPILCVLFPRSLSSNDRDAWKSVEGTSKEAAQAKYVELLLEVRSATLPRGTAASPLPSLLPLTLHPGSQVSGQRGREEVPEGARGDRMITCPSQPRPTSKMPSVYSTVCMSGMYPSSARTPPDMRHNSRGTEDRRDTTCRSLVERSTRETGASYMAPYPLLLAHNAPRGMSGRCQVRLPTQTSGTRLHAGARGVSHALV